MADSLGNSAQATEIPTVPFVRLQFPELAEGSGACLDIIRASASSGLGVVLGLNAFIAAVFDGRPLGTASGSRPSSAEDIFKSGWAECGDREYLISELLKPLGIPTRRVGFVGTPIQGGHTAIEVFADGKWRFLDPTFGIYICALNNDEPLSLGEARVKFPDVTIKIGVAPLWSGLPAGGLRLDYRDLIETAIVAPKLGYEVAYPLETYFLSRAMGAEIISHDNIFIPLDLTTQSTLEIGSPLGESNDNRIADPISTQYGSVVPMLYDRIGRYFDGNVCHNFMTIVGKPTIVDIDVQLRSGSTDSLYALAEPAVSPGDEYERHLAVRRAYRTQCWPRSAVSFRYVALPPYSILRVSTGWGADFVKQVASYRVTSRPLEEWKDVVTLGARATTP